MRRHELMAVTSLLLGCGMAAVGCGDSKPPRAAAAKATRASRGAHSAAKGLTAAEAEAALVEEGKSNEVVPDTTGQAAEYVYTPIGKRDPFRSPFVDVTSVAVLPSESLGSRVAGPLQRWGVEQLSLRATVTGTGAPMAMLVDPDNYGHVVKRGALVGKNWGKVTSIRRDCITITEQLRDASGAVNAIKSERCLPKTTRERDLEKQLAKGM